MEHQDNSSGDEIKNIIRQVVKEYAESERERAEPAYKAELLEERRRREELERRVNELVEDNRRSQAIAEEAERSSAIRAELQRQGIAKPDLAFKVVKEDVRRRDDGRLVGLCADGELPLREYVAQFVSENPEFLPARLSGGSGSGATQRSEPRASRAPIDVDSIRPGMKREDLDRIRQEVARVAMDAMAGK
jgi:hypothetical protein